MLKYECVAPEMMWRFCDMVDYEDLVPGIFPFAMIGTYEHTAALKAEKTQS